MNPDLDFAIANNFHQMTASDFGAELRKLIEAQPQYHFAELPVGEWVFYHERGESQRVFNIVSMAPKGGQATVLTYKGDGIPFKIYKGSYDYYPFTLLNEGLLSLLGVPHEAIVKEGVQRGFEIPNLVRIYYPDLFIEIPERFTIRRLKDILEPSYLTYTTRRGIENMIVAKLARFAEKDDLFARLITKNPALRKDQEKYFEYHVETLDFYRWVEPLVSPGGVFYIETTPCVECGEESGYLRERQTCARCRDQELNGNPFFMRGQRTLFAEAFSKK